MPELERRISFRPGYNYLHETGPTSRGQHGMEIHFTLIGEAGATDFGLGTHWTPLGRVDEGKKFAGRDPAVHCDEKDDWGFGLIRPPSGICIGIHRVTPFPHDPEAEFNTQGSCNLLKGKRCYWDGSFTAADPVLKAFIDSGEGPVWEALEQWYNSNVLDQEVDSPTN